MTIERFLDVEARREDSDEEDYDDEEGDDLPDFIGNDETEDIVAARSNLPEIPSSNDTLEDWTEDLLRRYSSTLDQAEKNRPEALDRVPLESYPLVSINTTVGSERRVCQELRQRLPVGRHRDILFTLYQQPGRIYWSFSSDEPFKMMDHLEGLPVLRHQDSAPVVDEIAVSELPEVMAHFVPNSNFPVWRVKCKLGWESTAVYYIRKMLPNGRDNDRVFVLASSPRFIFWSVSPVPSIDVRAFLRPIPGIYIEKGDIVASTIPPTEWDALVSKFLSPRHHLVVGRWVRILKGKYQNEVGVISSATPTCAAVLVLPRFDLTDASTWTRKRKRGYRPAKPCLFDPQRIAPNSLKVIDVDRAIYEFAGVRYDHGLALVFIPSINLDVVVCGIEYETVHQFFQSKHPLLSARTVPGILDWAFRPGQHVRRVGDAMKEGLVEEVNDDGVVMLSSGSSIQLSWLEVMKVFFVGDYVKIFAGICLGREGWVEYTEGSSVHIINKSRKYIERITVHANSCDLFPAPGIPKNRIRRCKPLAMETLFVGQHVRITDEEHRFTGYAGTVKEVREDEDSPSRKVVRVDLFAQNIRGDPIVLVDSEKVDPLTQDEIARQMVSGPTPWLGLSATIIQPGHPFRTYPAIVRDVLIHQSTPSGLMLQLEITTYQGANPRRTVTIDYDYVVDPETQWELRLKQPLAVEQSAFIPPDTYVRKRLEIRIPPASPMPLHEAPRSSTPPPPPERCSSPTWDPAAELPRDLPRTGLFHWAEYADLMDIPLRVNDVKNGKQIVVRSRWNDKKGCASLFTTWRGKEREIRTEAIEARAPKARWSGLLVVIHGEYGNIGKLVRPVRQRYEAGITHWTVRVVKPVPGHPDVITDEELVLPSTHFCEVEESGESKRWNEGQAQTLKEPAAGHCFP